MTERSGFFFRLKVDLGDQFRDTAQRLKRSQSDCLHEALGAWVAHHTEKQTAELTEHQERLITLSQEIDLPPSKQTPRPPKTHKEAEILRLSGLGNEITNDRAPTRETSVEIDRLAKMAEESQPKRDRPKLPD